MYQEPNYQYGQRRRQQQAQPPSAESRFLSHPAVRNAAKQGLNSALGYGASVANVGNSSIAGVNAATKAASAASQATNAAGSASTAAVGAGGTPLFQMGGMSYAGYLGAALQGVNAVNSWDSIPNENRATYAQQQAALMAANLYTGGLAGAAEGYLRGNKTTAKYMGKLDKFDQKTNPISIALTKSGWLKGNRFLDEQTDRAKLIKKGYVGWDQLNLPVLSKGRSKEELLAIEQANKAAGRHSNEKFAMSRDEKDLGAEDIWGYSAFGEKFGNDWLGKFSEDQRRQIAQKALDSGSVREGRGQINVKWSPELDEQVKGISEAQPASTPAPSQTTQQSQPRQQQNNRIPRAQPIKRGWR